MKSKDTKTIIHLDEPMSKVPERLFWKAVKKAAFIFILISAFIVWALKIYEKFFLR